MARPSWKHPGHKDGQQHAKDKRSRTVAGTRMTREEYIEQQERKSAEWKPSWRVSLKSALGRGKSE